MAKAKKSILLRFEQYLSTYNYIGLCVGMLFAAISFTPSILPRGWVMQALLAGLTFAIGYGVGLIISHLARKLPIKEPIKQTKHKTKRWTYIILGLIYVFALIRGYTSQNEVRELVGVTEDPTYTVIGITILSIAVALMFIGISRLIRKLFRWLTKQVDRLLPRSVSYVIAFVATFLVVYGIVNGVIIDKAMDGISAAYSTRNDTTDEGIVKPTSSNFSGSPESLISWESLGKQGRKFIGTTVPQNNISKFTGKPAQEPVRAYAGLETKDTSKERAEIAVQDLKRAGGFDKEILVVVTTTGTGWVNETAANSIEYMYGGDSAIVSMQYSYLPSWLSFLVDKERAKEAGIDLFNAVHEEWLEVPENERPLLISYGESLGSFGTEAAFPTAAAFNSTSQGILLVGPPSSNSFWEQIVASRDEGSRQVLPVVEDGKRVRFAARTPDLSAPTAEWQEPRAVYLQHGSDPIVWWSPALIYEKPDWLKEKRADDVSADTFWFPIVTFWQLSADMAFSTGVPDGYGHNYGTLVIDAWSYVAPPEGWNAEKNEALKAEISKNL